MHQGLHGFVATARVSFSRAPKPSLHDPAIAPDQHQYSEPGLGGMVLVVTLKLPVHACLGTCKKSMQCRHVHLMHHQQKV